MPDVSVRQDAPSATESSVPNAIAGAPDVSVRQDTPDTQDRGVLLTAPGAPDDRPSPAAPTNEAADVVSAVLNHAAQTPTPAGAVPQVNLYAREMLHQRGVQAVRLYVRRTEFQTDADLHDQGFAMWMENARIHDYDRLEPDHLYRLADSRGHSCTEDNVNVREVRNLLYRGDFDTFARNAVGAYDAGGLSRLETFERLKSVLGEPLHAVQIALFAWVTNPWNIDKEELQWIIYLFNAQFNMAQVLTMTKGELVALYNNSLRQGCSGWPKISATTNRQRRNPTHPNRHGVPNFAETFCAVRTNG
jgi:hypothetical protein